MSQSAHTFTPKDDSLAERMNAYIRVQQDYELFKQNSTSLDAKTLGEQEDVAEAQIILLNSLSVAFESIDESELQEAVKQGLYANDELVCFIESKRELEIERLRSNKHKQSDSKKHSLKR